MLPANIHRLLQFIDLLLDNVPSGFHCELTDSDGVAEREPPSRRTWREYVHKPCPFNFPCFPDFLVEVQRVASIGSSYIRESVRFHYCGTIFGGLLLAQDWRSTRNGSQGSGAGTLI